MNKTPIDIIILWVDGSDPDWIKLFNQYAPDSNKKNIDTRESRYKEHGLLKYLFRSIEKNAPWVRKIHFVTNGQLPDWLNINTPKLNWVKHSDYIDSKYLPTFSANPIELNLHRIKDLSENFIFFNDDMFILNKINEDYFFHNDLPVMHTAATLKWLKYPKIFSNIVFNDVKLINKKFSYQKVVLKHPIKWLFMNPIKCNFGNLLFLFQNFIPGFGTQHQANPYTKTTLSEVWDEFSEELSKTCFNRFRTAEDINQFIFYYWQLCKGNFYPKKKNTSKYFVVTDKNYSKIKKCFDNNTTKLLCLNENDYFDYSDIYNDIIKLFENKFPDKSSFEK